MYVNIFINKFWRNWNEFYLMKNQRRAIKKVHCNTFEWISECVIRRRTSNWTDWSSVNQQRLLHTFVMSHFTIIKILFHFRRFFFNLQQMRTKWLKYGRFCSFCKFHWLLLVGTGIGRSMFYCTIWKLANHLIVCSKWRRKKC